METNSFRKADINRLLSETEINVLEKEAGTTHASPAKFTAGDMWFIQKNYKRRTIREYMNYRT